MNRVSYFLGQVLGVLILIVFVLCVFVIVWALLSVLLESAS